MSTHCNKYPLCGCPKEIGNKCNLSDEQLKSEIEREFITRNKEYEYKEYSRMERGSSSINPKKKHATNYTPPKKRRK